MKRFFVGLLILGFLTSCSSPGKPANSLNSKNAERNVLTNLPGKNGPVLAVKIDDTPPAHPQVGLASADVIYIEQVEGGLTRLAAIYSNVIPRSIGPVRSARISDIEILAQYGHLGFAFSGAQAKMYPVIAAANLENIGAERNPPSIYSRDSSRPEPTNLFLDPAALLKKTIETEKKNIDIVKSVGWQFGSAPDAHKFAQTSKAILSAKIHWPASKYEVKWSNIEKRWLIFYGGAPDMGSDGGQLGSPNFVIQIVPITDSIYHDKVGGITPFSNTVGSGSGYLLRDGKAIAIKWQRPVATAGTIWTLSDGSVAKFADGQVWIALTDQDPAFEFPPVIAATPSPSSK
jgi:Protein of unknown function (DUF3048) N-terminal domain/Protein of unknown function (DUF3048) C-terminal domain